MIIAWFISKYSSLDRQSKVIEIGSGNGIISIVLKHRGFIPSITCFEIQKELFCILKKNIITNSLSHCLFPVSENFVSYPLESEKYDAVFTNPPYYSVGSGRLSPSSQKAHCKYEFYGSLEDFFKKSSFILKKKASLFCIYPVSKIQSCLSCAYKYDMHAKEIIMTKEYYSSQPSLFCVRFIKSKSRTTLTEFDTITMKKNSGEYTETGKNIMFSDEKNNKF
ncbi:MAG: methyltransferase [bacterium]